MGKIEERTKMLSARHILEGDERACSQQLLLESIANDKCSEMNEAELVASFVNTLNHLNTICALIAHEPDRLEPQKPILRPDDRLN